MASYSIIYIERNEINQLMAARYDQINLDKDLQVLLKKLVPIRFRGELRLNLFNHHVVGSSFTNYWHDGVVLFIRHLYL